MGFRPDGRSGGDDMAGEAEHHEDSPRANTALLNTYGLMERHAREKEREKKPSGFTSKDRFTRRRPRKRDPKVLILTIQSVGPCANKKELELWSGLRPSPTGSSLLSAGPRREKSPRRKRGERKEYPGIIPETAPG